MKKHLPLLYLLTALTVIFGTIYATSQQLLRMNANDPQIQIAEDTAQALNKGADPQNVAQGKIDIAKSLANFLIIYDKSGHVVAGNGYLNDHRAIIPLGVLKAAHNQDYNAVTWQPQKDVRIASVSTVANGYYVLSGRSLKEVESREQQVMQLVFLGWIACVTVLVLGPYIYKKLSYYESR